MMDGVITKASEFVVKFFFSCFCVEVGHICRLDKNLEALEEAMVVLRGRRDDVWGRVVRDEETGLERLHAVRVWLTAVEKIENQSHETKRACTRQGSFLCEVCSGKLASRFRYGKEVVSMLEDVEELRVRKLTEDLTGVAVPPPMRDAVGERDLQPIIVGQETMLASAWNRLMDDGTQLLGLYGMGGVGKSTLLEQINNKFCGASDEVYIVFWVVVSKDKPDEKIRDEIAAKLHISGEGWKQKANSDKVACLYSRMKEKKFVLLLDDIWREIDLKEIGVPIPTEENGCKVVFTTRSREVCGQMGVHDPMEVKCLDPDQAWDFFRAKVGEVTLESHPDILELAYQVAGKCRGLPLALNIMGKNMASKRTVREWDHAIDTLASNAANFPGMKDHIFPVLKYSYDSLREDHQVKSCFRYCALFPEDFEIETDKLVDYWICEGFIDEKQGKKRAENQAYGIIGTLVEACLLSEEGKDKSKVKMHDVVREMALWIETEFGKHKERWIVKAGIGLRHVPRVENWTSVRRMSLMENRIKNISDTPNFPELTTLLLHENEIVYISGEFFKSMPRLVVLDLSHNMFRNGLSEEISNLVSLRYLDLSRTDIKRLPGGLLKLFKLIHLNLDDTWKLESISRISSLSSLRTLRLEDSKTLIDLGFLEELELLKHLEVVTLEISSSLAATKLLGSHRLVKCIEFVRFKNLEEFMVVMILPTMVSLRRLALISCGMREIKIERTTSSSSWNKMPTATCFPNLSSITIRGCDGLMDLTWLLFAQNLTDLEVGQSMELEEIISEEKAVDSIIVPFRKLNNLTLAHLPNLKSIYGSPLPFPALKEISVTWCPELRKLPLDSKSVGRVEELEIYWIPLSLSPKEAYRTYAPLTGQWNCLDLSSVAPAEGWLEGVEWEDEATRLRFLPSCTLRHHQRHETKQVLALYFWNSAKCMELQKEGSCASEIKKDP